MKETPQSIAIWADETFGAAVSPSRVIARANEELAELIRAMTAGCSAEEAIEEVADVAIVLLGRSRMFAVNGSAPTLELHHPRSMGVSPAAYAGRAMQSLGRLLEAVEHRFTDRHAESSIPRRLDFVLSDLCFVAAGIGRNLGAAIDAKMEINRARTWRKDGTGHGYHKRAE